MLTRYTIYDTATGAILESGVQEETHIPAPGAGQSIIFGVDGNPRTEWVVDGVVVKKPPPSTADKLKRRRLEMKLTPPQFFEGLWKAGLLTAEEAIAAATVGAMPPKVEAAVGRLPGNKRTAARIKWAARSVVRRDDALIALVADAFDQTDAQIDQLFDSKDKNGNGNGNGNGGR